MSRVHVTTPIADDYCSRDVYEPAWKGGKVEIDQTMLADMIDDADYQARWTDWEDYRMRRAYRIHHRKLLACSGGAK